MKKSILFVAVALMMSACGFLQNSTSSNQQQAANEQPAVQQPVQTEQSNAAQSAGQGAGTALKALYAQYLADGKKFDYTNLQNIMNTLSLVNNCQGLKENFKDKTYRSEFGKGLIVGSLGLVQENNVQTVTTSLVDMLQNNETLQQTNNQVQQGLGAAAGYANTASQYASTLSALLGALGGK